MFVANPAALLRAENPRERSILPHLMATLGGISHGSDQLLHRGRGEQLPPPLQGTDNARRIIIAGDPTGDVAYRHVSQFGASPDFGGNGLVIEQTELVVPGMGPRFRSGGLG